MATWDELLRGLALLLIVEGLMPFLVPHRFRTAMIRLLSLDDRTLRTVGFLSMLSGLLVLQAVRWLL